MTPQLTVTCISSEVPESPMKEHEFTVLLATPEESDDDCDRLYKAGCSDGSIST